jgi:hypothetical protein
MHPRFAPGGDESKRAFTYMVLTGGRFIYASAIRLVVLKFLLSMSVSEPAALLSSKSPSTVFRNTHTRTHTHARTHTDRLDHNDHFFSHRY